MKLTYHGECGPTHRRAFYDLIKEYRTPSSLSDGAASRRPSGDLDVRNDRVRFPTQKWLNYAVEATMRMEKQLKMMLFRKWKIKFEIMIDVLPKINSQRVIKKDHIFNESLLYQT
ncbi:hypothetical protein EVAR_24005_1 [Eumeta japonica]|uniref:Uncharacterized protein n=1 Tax=Eumeta variegata TaxID=151549 RepID=A0A4C1WC99_EUMVA|nr:hypothetical protein EVAR_24005_1 [Eumeta japonica]